MKAWKLKDDGHALELYDLDPSTNNLQLKQTLKFNRQLGFEEAVSFIKTQPMGYTANQDRRRK